MTGTILKNDVSGLLRTNVANNFFFFSLPRLIYKPSVILVYWISSLRSNLKFLREKMNIYLPDTAS